MASLAFGMGKCSLYNLKVLISEWYLISDQGCVFIKVCNDTWGLKSISLYYQFFVNWFILKLGLEPVMYCNYIIQ